MFGDYIAIVADAALDGHRRYAAAVRELVRRARPDLAAAVVAEAFTEPLVFAAFSSGVGQQWLDQLLCGYLRDGTGLDPRPVRAGPEGSVYMPAIGTWTIGKPSPGVEARWCRQDGGFRLYADCQRVDVDFQPIVRLGPAGTELIEGGHPLLSRFYAELAPGAPGPGFEGLAEAHSEHLVRALAVVSEVAPEYAEPLLAVTHKVVLHHGEEPSSFATPGAHGAVFLNMRPGDDEVSLVEDLVHQGGQVLFSAASFDRERWFRIDRDTPLEVLTGRLDDQRSLYEALHALFTETAVVEVLDAWYDSSELSSRQRHELSGRLAFALRQLSYDLRFLAHRPALDADGRQLLHAIAEVWRDVSTRRRTLSELNLDNQGGSFDYERFAALNRPLVA